jgi:hypothetical protein
MVDRDVEVHRESRRPRDRLVGRTCGELRQSGVVFHGPPAELGARAAKESVATAERIDHLLGTAAFTRRRFDAAPASHRKCWHRERLAICQACADDSGCGGLSHQPARKAASCGGKAEGSEASGCFGQGHVSSSLRRIGTQPEGWETFQFLLQGHQDSLAATGAPEETALESYWRDSRSPRR